MPRKVKNKQSNKFISTTAKIWFRTIQVIGEKEDVHDCVKALKAKGKIVTKFEKDPFDLDAYRKVLECREVTSLTCMSGLSLTTILFALSLARGDHLPALAIAVAGIISSYALSVYVDKDNPETKRRKIENEIRDLPEKIYLCP